MSTRFDSSSENSVAVLLFREVFLLVLAGIYLVVVIFGVIVTIRFIA